jgi:hypothetical protein
MFHQIFEGNLTVWNDQDEPFSKLRSEFGDFNDGAILLTLAEFVALIEDSFENLLQRVDNFKSKGILSKIRRDARGGKAHFKPFFFLFHPVVTIQ